MDVDISKGLFYSDGCVVHKDTVILAAGFNSSPNTLQSRAIFTLDEEWRQFDIPTDMMVSVALCGETAYLAGTGGLLIEVPLFSGVTLDMIDNANMWEIEDVMEYGQITRIRTISGQPYCCGQSGQVYRLTAGQWDRADSGLRTIGGPDLEDIAGNGPSDIYVVGIQGSMFHFNGSRWDTISLPTNGYLSNIRCVSSNLCYACGNDGLLLKGFCDQWEIVSEPIPDKNYWGLEIFKGSVYLAHGSGIDCLTPDGIKPVEINLDGNLSFHRLHSCADQLWSFGIDHVLVFDGDNWKEVNIPVR